MAVTITSKNLKNATINLDRCLIAFAYPKIYDGKWYINENVKNGLKCIEKVKQEDEAEIKELRIMLNDLEAMFNKISRIHNNGDPDQTEIFGDQL